MYIVYKNSVRTSRRSQFASINFGSPVIFTGYIVGLTVHMEGTWTWESTSVGLHPCEASIQKQCEGCADTAWGQILTLTTT
jgi:hypothetical protein